MGFEKLPEGAETLLFRIPAPLVRWYRSGARDLPWRRTQDPYRVWVSEIMLQQTRVEAVKPYYERFLERYPDPRSLAEGGEELFKLWEGLGYYSRARNLRAAAVQICGKGGFPRNYRELLELKGIGPYTAAAISSICFGEPVAAVDGNVLRVLSRLLCIEEDPSSPALRKEIFRALCGAMPQGREGLPASLPTPFGQPRNDAGDFNQAMMELGARVCLPNGAPLCGTCPLAGFCRACALGVQTSYPVRPEKKARKAEPRTVFLLRKEGKYALRRRPETGLLAGLWEFPSVAGNLSAREAAQTLGCGTEKLTPLGEAKHVFTHLEWHMTGWLVELLAEGKEPDGFGELVFVSPEELERKYALPSALEYYRKRAK